MDNSAGKKDERVNIKLARRYLPSLQALKGITGEAEYGKAIERAVRIINAGNDGRSNYVIEDSY